MVTKKQLIGNELVREIIRIRIDALAKMLELEAKDRLPKRGRKQDEQQPGSEDAGDSAARAGKSGQTAGKKSAKSSSGPKKRPAASAEKGSKQAGSKKSSSKSTKKSSTSRLSKKKPR